MENSISSTTYDLLILSCSRAKDDNHLAMPAIDRYDGPVFRTLRSWVKINYPRMKGALPSHLQVYILSGRYGLVWHNTPIPYYDQKMTLATAAMLSVQVLQVLLDIRNGGDDAGTPPPQPRRVMFIGPQSPYGDMVRNLDALFNDSRVTMNINRIGLQCHFLKEWLNEGRRLRTPAPTRPSQED